MEWKITENRICDSSGTYSLEFLLKFHLSLILIDHDDPHITSGPELIYKISRVLIPDRSKRFFLLHCVQTGSWAHPSSYPMGTGGSFPAGEVAGG
jgi:hypothetical protein